METDNERVKNAITIWRHTTLGQKRGEKGQEPEGSRNRERPEGNGLMD